LTQGPVHGPLDAYSSVSVLFIADSIGNGIEPRRDRRAGTSIARPDLIHDRKSVRATECPSSIACGAARALLSTGTISSGSHSPAAQVTAAGSEQEPDKPGRRGPVPPSFRAAGSWRKPFVCSRSSSCRHSWFFRPPLGGVHSSNPQRVLGEILLLDPGCRRALCRRPKTPTRFPSPSAANHRSVDLAERSVPTWLQNRPPALAGAG
jgi:hypothetical protein